MYFVQTRENYPSNNLRLELRVLNCPNDSAESFDAKLSCLLHHARNVPTSPNTTRYPSLRKRERRCKRCGWRRGVARVACRSPYQTCDLVSVLPVLSLHLLDLKLPRNRRPALSCLVHESLDISAPSCTYTRCDICRIWKITTWQTWHLL